MYLAIDEKGNDPCIWIEHSIFNVNKIGVILTLVCVDQRYPATLKRSEPNYLGVGSFPRPLVKGSEDTGYEVVLHHGKFKLLNHYNFFSISGLHVPISFVARASGRVNYACQGLNNFWRELEQ